MKLFIFGATGDLMKKKVSRALKILENKKLEIVALGRNDLTDADYVNSICDDCFTSFEHAPKYRRVAFGLDNPSIECAGCEKQLDRDRENYFYSALPPLNAGGVIKYVGELARKGFKIKLLLEKPFGVNLKNARQLNKLIDEYQIEPHTYLSDHYLFKEGVMELGQVSFSKIKIVNLETTGLEGRNAYDQMGALKDVVQSHFLNIVFKLLPNARKEFSDFEVLKFEKRQYADYTEELGKPSETETFVDIKLKTREREYEFITGKKFPKRQSYIEIDDKIIDIKSNEGDYKRLLESFLSGERHKFPTIENTLLDWEIIDKIINTEV